MEVTSHGPQEVVGLTEPQGRIVMNKIEIHQTLNICDIIEVARNPVQGMEIAQPSLVFLDVRFKHITAVAEIFMPLIAFFEFGLNKTHACTFNDFFSEATL